MQLLRHMHQHGALRKGPQFLLIHTADKKDHHKVDTGAQPDGDQKHDPAHRQDQIQTMVNAECHRAHYHGRNQRLDEGLHHLLFIFQVFSD